MSDSFSNLVHRPTIDQFTEGVASKMSSPAWTLVALGPGRGGEKSCSFWCSQGGCALAECLGHGCLWPMAFGGRVRAGEAQPPNITS